MTIRIPPPDPNDVIGPDAAMVVNQASAEMTNWIETRVGELRDKAIDQVNTIKTDFETTIGDAESDLDAALKAEEAEINGVVAKIVEMTKSLDSNVDSEQLRLQVQKELQERNERLLSVGRSVIDKAKKAAGKLTGLSVLLG